MNGGGEWGSMKGTGRDKGCGSGSVRALTGSAFSESSYFIIHHSSFIIPQLRW